MTEGRGPMAPTEMAFKDKDKAIKYIEAAFGVMGCQGEKVRQYSWNNKIWCANDHEVREFDVI